MLNYETHRRFALLGTIIFALILAGCGGSGSSSNPAEQPTNGGEVQSMTVDASAGGFPPNPDIGFSYVDLLNGKVLDLTDEQADDSKAWHIAFRRTDIKLNGGVSGPGSVRGAIAHTPPHFYDENGRPNMDYFKDPNINPESMLNELLQVTLDDSRNPDLEYKEDRLIPFITNDGSARSWFKYDMTTHQLSPNNELWWILSSRSGKSFAKMNVVALDQTARSVGIDLYIQKAGETSFSVNSVHWDAKLDQGNAVCYDFEATEQVTCDQSNWDLMFEVEGRNWTLWTNSKAKGNGRGGAFGPVNSAEIGDFTSAEDVPRFFPDSKGGVFADHYSTYNWAVYAERTMWPNYRVYVLDLGNGKRLAMQITSYYHPETGDSGHYTFRYRFLN